MMKIDPESWPTLSRLLDQWLDLPEEVPRRVAGEPRSGTRGHSAGASEVSLEEAILGSDAVRRSQTAEDRKLSRTLKGDLDSIALKALSKAPQERYPTADAFAQDIEN